MNWGRGAVEAAVMLLNFVCGFLLGTFVRARRDRARAARLATLDRFLTYPPSGEVDAVMNAVFGPPHHGYREPPP